MTEFNYNNSTSDSVDKEVLKEIFDRFIKVFFPNKNLQVSVRVINQKEMIALNKLVFGKSEPTDVISLETKLPTTPKSLGDIVICSDVAKKNAKNLGHDLQREVEILFKHGLVHLLGLEHETKVQKEAWNKKLKRF